MASLDTREEEVRAKLAADDASDGTSDASDDDSVTAPLQAFALRLCEYLGDEFADRLMAFLDECPPAVRVDGAFSPQVYEAYQQFLVLTENSLEGFCKEEGITTDELHDRLQQLRATTDFGDQFLDALFATWEFEAFFKLLEQFQAVDAAAGSDDSGSDATSDSSVSRSSSSPPPAAADDV